MCCDCNHHRYSTDLKHDPDAAVPIHKWTTPKGRRPLRIPKVWRAKGDRGGDSLNCLYCGAVVSVERSRYYSGSWSLADHLTRDSEHACPRIFRAEAA